MRRLVLVCLFVLTSMAAWAPGISAETDGLPKAPQSKGDGLEFSVEGAIADNKFGSPLNWGPNEDGRLFLLVTINVKNTNSDSRTLNSDNFRIVNGSEFISADDSLSKRPEELDIPAMGDVLGDVLDGKKSKLYILGWRLEPKIDDYVLDIDYGSAKTIDLQPWLDLDIRPGDLRVAQPQSSTTSRASSRASSRPTATETSSGDEITNDEQDYLDDVVDDSSRLGDAGGELADLFGQIADNQYIFLDASWVSDVETQLDVFRSVYARAQTLSPSPRQASIQDIWLSLTSSAATAADDYSTGIATLDPSLIDAGNIALDQATNLSDNLLDEINAFRDDPAAFGSTNTDSASDSDQGLVTDCSAFASYDEAQAYYADNADAQQYLDPDDDGQACEVYFGRG